MAVVLTILASAIVAGYESIEVSSSRVRSSTLPRLQSPRRSVSRETKQSPSSGSRPEKRSAALRQWPTGTTRGPTGLASLSVLFSALGVALGYPLADPIIGLLITALILKIVWESASSVLLRLLDGIDPAIVTSSETPRLELRRLFE